MVPVQALEVSTLTLSGTGGRNGEPMLASTLVNLPQRAVKSIFSLVKDQSWLIVEAMIRPAIVSSIIALAVEIPICIFLSLWGMKEFAFYISNSEGVAVITRTMWRVSSPEPSTTI
jgi:hypothetical protein